VDRRARQSLDGISKLLDRTTPWLSDVGSWIFGGLVAADLVVISALLTVGPVDAAIRIAVTALVCALPLNVAGIILLRLMKDLNEFGVDDHALQAFRESGFSDIDAYFPSAPDRAALSTRRTGLALRYSLVIATLSTGLTLAGTDAALWHMSWWIAVIFLVMVALSAGAVVAVFAHAQPPVSASSDRQSPRLRRRITDLRG